MQDLTPSFSETLVCNEFVFFAYGRAGEKLPYSLDNQIKYFQQQNRYTTDSSKGEVGDVAFYDGPPHHEVIVRDVRKEGKINWYHYSGSHFHGESGDFLSRGDKVYISQKGQPATLMNDKLIPWRESSVRGFIGLKGFGKAGRG